MRRLRPRIGRRRTLAATALVAVLLAAMLAAPANAHAIFGVDAGEIAEDIFGWFLETFFGVSADITKRIVQFLVALPVYTNGERYPELNDLRRYLSAAAWGFFGLMFTAAATRYWAAGFTHASSYAAIEAMGRCAVVAGVLAVYPQLFESATVAANLTTHGIIEAPHVREGITKVLATAAVLSIDSLGLSTIAAVVEVVLLVLLIVNKIVLATILAVLYVAGPLAIALWPLPETSWLARTWAQSLFSVLLWPIIWALCFAVFAVMGAASFTFSGELGDELVKPWVSVAALYAAFKLPQLVARQAMMAGLTPSLGRGMAQGAAYTKAAQSAGSSAPASSAAPAARAAAGGAG